MWRDYVRWTWQSALKKVKWLTRIPYPAFPPANTSTNTTLLYLVTLAGKPNRNSMVQPTLSQNNIITMTPKTLPWPSNHFQPISETTGPDQTLPLPFHQTPPIPRTFQGTLLVQSAADPLGLSPHQALGYWCRPPGRFRREIQEVS